jgi:hypothetical protein
MPPVGCGVGHPITYQDDITLIIRLVNGGSPDGPAGGWRAGAGDLPGGDALVLADQVHARVDQRQVREDPEEAPRVPAGVRFYLLGVQQQRAGAGRQLLAQRPGARLASPIPVSAETSHNERFGAPPADLVERITTVQIGGSARVLPIFSITYRDAVCRGSPMPPPTRCGVTGLEVVVGRGARRCCERTARRAG